MTMNNAIINDAVSELSAQLTCCPYVRGAAREYLEHYLMMQRIRSLDEISGDMIAAYQVTVRNDGTLTKTKKRAYVSLPEQVLYAWHAPDYPELIAEGMSVIQSRPVRNRVLTYLMMHGIKDAVDIDYSVRSGYETFLAHTVPEETRDRYTKGLDNLKLEAMHQLSAPQRAARMQAMDNDPKMMFLPYYPDYGVAQSFYYVQDKSDLLFDFSAAGSATLKEQIYRMLRHVLDTHAYATARERHDRRERFLIPLKLFYEYCIASGVEDLDYLEEEDIAGFRAAIEGRAGSKTDIYMQVISNTREYIFVSAQETNWEASVWYMARFTSSATRGNPSNPIRSFSFMEIHNIELRKAFQQYMRYLIGISSKNAMQTIRTEYYAVRDFLLFTEEEGYSMKDFSEEVFEDFAGDLDTKELQAESYNTKCTYVLLFLQYLKAQKICPRFYVDIDRFRKKTFAKHHNRTVPEDTLVRLIKASYVFPEMFKIMFLLLVATGRRKNEICQLKGKDVRWTDNIIHVYEQKMKHDNVIPIPGIVADMLNEYVQKNNVGDEEYLFKARDGGPYRIGTFSKKMNKLFENAGVSPSDYKFRAHDFRHTIATAMYHDGVELQVIREYLGHKSTDMTKQYIDIDMHEVNALNEQYYAQGGDSLIREALEKWTTKL